MRRKRHGPKTNKTNTTVTEKNRTKPLQLVTNHAKREAHEMIQIAKTNDVVLSKLIRCRRLIV